MYQPMYGQGYPLQYYPPGYPLQYYPPLAATTAYYPAMQPAPVRPTIMVPVSVDMHFTEKSILDRGMPSRKLEHFPSSFFFSSLCFYNGTFQENRY